MKNIILTGANGQLGRSFSEFLQANGYFVYALDIDVSNIEKTNSVEPVKIDITDEDSVNDFFNTVDEVYGLINNAGIGVFTSFEERTAEEFKKVMDVNLLGTFLMCKNAIIKMKKQKYGKIVNIGSIYGVKSSDYRIYGDSGRNNSEVYSATKAGVIMMTKYLSANYAQENIQVNAISPGGILREQSEDFVSNYTDKTPAGRMGNPTDLHSSLKLLLDENSNYINGQNITVDGGFTSW